MNKERRGRYSMASRNSPRHNATVSVVIPCYNYADFLPIAVHSVASQEGVQLQIIVVNDASTDRSLDVATELASQYDQLIVVNNEFNRGPVATFNRGLEYATGELLVRLDADDLLTPGSLRRAVDVAQAFPEVGLVYGHPIHFSGEALPRAREQVKGWSKWEGQDWLEDRCRSARNVITSPEVLMRMSVVRTVGGQKNLAHTHDMEMWMRIAAVSDVVYIRGADQAWHRDHPESLSARKVNVTTDFEQRWLAFETLFENLDPRDERLLSLLSIARTALVREGLKSAQVELQLGVPDPELFEKWLSLVRRIGPSPEQEDQIVLYQAEALTPRSSRLHKTTTLLRRAHRRLARTYRQKHWANYGVY